MLLDVEYFLHLLSGHCVWRSFFSSVSAILEVILILKETLSPNYDGLLTFNIITLTMYSISYIMAHYHVPAAFVFAPVRLAQTVSTGLEKETHQNLLKSEQPEVGIN